MPPKSITVIAKGDFGYHPASGQHLREGETYTIEEDAFSGQLFDLIKGEEPAQTEEGGSN